MPFYYLVMNPEIQQIVVRRKLSSYGYDAYWIIVCEGSYNILIKLFHQYIVDKYAKIKKMKLFHINTHLKRFLTPLI